MMKPYPRTAAQKAQRKAKEQAKRALIRQANPHRAPMDGTTCRNCGRPMSICREETKACSSCGQNIAACTEAQHQADIYCRVATVARGPKDRGLVRSPGDGLLAMLDEVGIPYELHKSRLIHPKDLPEDERAALKIANRVGYSFVILEEAWVPPETIAIVQTNRPLADRMAALRKFAGYLAKCAG